MKAVVFNSILKWHDKAWNEFSLTEESHVAYIACQANTDCFLNAARIIHNNNFVSEGTTDKSLGNVYRFTCAVSEMSSSETTAGCCCMKTCRLTTHWRWSSFLLPNRSAWYSNPLPARSGNSRLFLFPKVKLALKGRHFNDISDIEHDVTKLLKAVSFQNIQCTFKDLHKWSQHCVKLGGDYIESL